MPISLSVPALRSCISVLLLAIACVATSCQSLHRSNALAATTQSYAEIGLSDPIVWDSVKATVAPPAGWRVEPLKSSPHHQHQVWISPSGNTAYGVIRMSLPLPVGPDMVLGGFLREMKRSEGEATLIEKSNDDNLPGLRFVAQGGLYLVRTNMIAQGFEAWAIYAGTLRKAPINEEELKLAEQAREHTHIGKPGSSESTDGNP